MVSEFALHAYHSIVRLLIEAESSVQCADTYSAGCSGGALPFICSRHPMSVTEQSPGRRPGSPGPGSAGAYTYHIHVPQCPCSISAHKET
jgi:hypothetical protein